MTSDEDSKSGMTNTFIEKVGVISERFFAFNRMRKSELKAGKWLQGQFDSVVFLGKPYDFLCKSKGEIFIIEHTKGPKDIDRGQFYRIKNQIDGKHAKSAIMYLKSGKWKLDFEYFNQDFKSKEEIKKSQEEFLILILSQIEENGDNLHEICRRLNRSPSNLAYHLRIMKESGLIERVQSYPNAVYKLTEVGRTIKENKAYGDGTKPLYRCHALQIGFPIKDFGSFDFNQIRTRQVSGWKFVDEKVKDFYGKWNVRIQSTGLMIISCPEKVTDNVNSYFGAMYQVASRLGESYAESFKMKIGNMKIVRQGHKELIGSERIAKLLRPVKMKNIWIDTSQTNTPRLEENESSDSIERLMELPKTIDKKLIPAMEWMTKNIESHREVLQDISTAIKELRDAVREMKK